MLTLTIVRQAVEQLTHAEREKILGGNAAELLGMGDV